MRSMSVRKPVLGPYSLKRSPGPAMWILINFPSFLLWATFTHSGHMGRGRERLKVFKIQLLKWLKSVLSELQTYIPKNLMDVVAWMSWRNFKFNVLKVKHIICFPESCSSFHALGCPPPSFAMLPVCTLPAGGHWRPPPSSLHCVSLN